MTTTSTNGPENTGDGASSTAMNAPGGADDPSAAPSAFASIPTLADYLTNGYWAYSGYGGTDARSWDHATLTVNIEDLTAAERTIAQAAISLWHDVANLDFTYTTGAADITYTNEGSGSAVTSYSVSSGTISDATIHISSDWSGGAATGNYSYFFQTYVNQMGLALGLGHTGPYNGSATYGVDNIYTNDTWRWSVMSYFSQDNYGSDTYDFALTPQMADIYAVQAMYGAQTTRTGDTTYGFNSNAGSFWNFSTYSGTPALTIYDSGGTDTLDASGYSNAQTIDLTPGSWSSIGGETNNIGIYLTTTIENAYGGSGADTIVGNDANNKLYGNGGADTLAGGLGADTLDGGTGADTMTGGAGNDTYYVDNAGDKTIEAKNSGTDQVFSSVSYSLAGQYVENLTLTGSGNINATGNSLANTLTGNSGNNVLNGGAGNDVLNGGTGADEMTGGAGNDTYYVDNAGDTTVEANNGGTDQAFSTVSYSLAGQYVENLTLTGSGNTNATGNSLANRLTGNSGNNVLNGGTGADVMKGGAGDDTYYVDDAGDTVIEAKNSGTDQVFSTVSYNLAGQYIENLTLTGSGNINATGNSQNNTLAGNSGNNILNGLTGADVMIGGAGDDTYYVDNASDIAVEVRNAGTDQVFSSVSYNLAGQYIENLTLTGSGNTDATGNSLVNMLAGNSGNNVLNGGTGADTMAGGAGNDTYYVDDAGDTVIEAKNSGTDQVFSSVSYNLAGQFVENLTLTGSGNIDATGNSLANALTGNSGNNVLNGGAGNDVLNGGAGTDTLTGGSGLDTFVFESVLAGNIDTVADFSAANDTIQLDQSIFAAITTLGTLSATALFTGTAAHDADDRIIYNAATGNLFYDSDGTGANAAVQFAHLNGAPSISNTNFTVVA